MLYKNIDEFVLEAQKDIRIIKAGSLRFFGDWFGRPMDNCHKPKYITFRDQCLDIIFDDNYLVRIEGPKEIEVLEKKFIVCRAKKVRYEYGHYGINNTDRKYFREYTVCNEGIQKVTGRIADGSTHTSMIMKGNYCFEICGY